MRVPPGSILDVPIAAHGIEGPLTDVSLAVHVRHLAMEMLSFALLGPDMRMVLLTAFQGRTATSFGESAARPLVFTDEAILSITRAVPPLVGRYRPMGKLATYRGMRAAAANGRWHLMVMDVGTTGASALVASTVLILRT
jgi:hypothetical protein